MSISTTDREAVLAQLARVLASAVFSRADRSSALLTYIVEQTLDGKAERLKEYSLGIDALGRDATFDPRTDTVVRAEASRLRTRLEQYYGADGQADPILISLPKGGYLAQFEQRQPVTATSPVKVKDVRRFSLTTLLTVACVGVVVTIVIATSIHRNGRLINAATSGLVRQFDVELKSDGVLGSEIGNDIAISPDGQRIAFVARGSNAQTFLSTRKLAAADAVKLEGTEGAHAPFFSPDGRWIGFSADHKLKKIASEGGAPIIICELDTMMGASWSADDNIIVAMPPPSKQLWQVSPGGGKPHPVIGVPNATGAVVWPQILPGGRYVLYSANGDTGADQGNIEVRAIDGDTHKVLIVGGTYGRYVAGGYLTYVNQGTLFAVQFDLKALAVKGPPVPVVHDVSYSQLFGYAQYDMSQDGTLIYRKSTENAFSIIERIDRSGKHTPLLSKPGRYGWLRISPDAKQLAVTTTDSGARSILIHEIASGATRTLRTGDAGFIGLTWYQDGLFYGGVNGSFWLDARLPSEPLRLSTGVIEVPWSLSPDGARVAFYSKDQNGSFDLWTAAIKRNTESVELDKREPFLRSAALKFFPTFSPDGRWIAYSSDESGVAEVYVRRFPDSGYVVKLSNGVGGSPRWSPNGHELLYRSVDQKVMSVAYRISGNQFIPEAPHPWTASTLKDTGVEQNFDIAADGEHIIALLPAPHTDRQSVNHATFILNFHKEIERRLMAR